MYWKKLTLGITIVNLLSWVMIELWSYRYADGNIATAAGVLIAFHLIGYYLIVLVAHQPPKKELPPVLEKVTPLNCPGHDWQPSEYGGHNETCIKCKAVRGKQK